MADRKATNKYYPPDWDPSKGSINTYRKSHPLRDRARKIDQGIIVIRFELPFNIWCLKCDNHVGMGVRFNAEKSKVGNYYTSPIYRFKMKCHLCDNHFEIQTDPAKFDYIIISGARKQVMPVGDGANDDSTVTNGHGSKSDIADAMLRLERKVEDRIQGQSRISELQELKNWRTRWDDSFTANQILRSQFRKKRNKLEQRKLDDKKFLKKTCLNLRLLKPDPTDSKLAREMLLRSRLSDTSETKAKNTLLESSIIVKSSKTTNQTTKKASTFQPKSDHGRSVRIKKDPG